MKVMQESTRAMNRVPNVGTQAGSVMSDRSLASWEIASIISSVLIAEWILAAAAGREKVVVGIPIVLALGLIGFSHWARGEALRDLGFRLDNFAQATKLLVLPMAGVTAGCFLIGWLASSRTDFFRWHSERPIVGQLVLGFGWGLLQQYVLQSFINRRAQIIFGQGRVSVLLVAAIFGGLHLPNPWLTVLTLIGGLVWGTIYQRAPNLLALAISHSVMTWILISTLP